MKSRIKKILVDADCCSERARAVLERLGAKNMDIELVANKPLILQGNSHCTLTVCQQGNSPGQIVDEYILAHASDQTLIITRDLALAQELLILGATVISDSGEIYDIATISSRIKRARTTAQIRQLQISEGQGTQGRAGTQARRKIKQQLKAINSFSISLQGLLQDSIE